MKQMFDDLIKNGQSLISQIVGLEREYTHVVYQEIRSKPIKIITGFRRAGKSTIVKHVANKTVKDKIYKLKNILYLNFEDIELEIFGNAKELKLICDYFFEQNLNEDLLIILDEIQLVKNWSKLIRTIYEFKDNVQIILTGSNSELLSAELGSNLAGRFIEFNVQSFSFKELLQLKNILPKNTKEFYKEEKKIHELFCDYLRYGGLPEIFAINTDSAKKSYLEGIISKVVLDDIVKRFKVRNHSLIEKILSFILINIGNPISFSRIETHCKNLGFDVKVDTIIKYASYLEKTFAIIETRKFDWKSRKIFANDRKYYAGDVGLAYLYTDLDNNFSKRLENVVYLKLLRDNALSKFYYGYNEQEIDFIELNKSGYCLNKYQISQKIHEKNIEREISSLVSSSYFTGQSSNYLMVLEKAEEKDIEIKDAGFSSTIKQRNLIKWLLDL
jgi:hypothetical protein